MLLVSSALLLLLVSPGLAGFGLEEVLSGELQAQGFSGTWTSGAEFLYTNMQTGDVMRYDMRSLAARVLLRRAVLEEFQATSYELAADGSFLLIGYDQQAGFRHSTASRFLLYDLSYNNYQLLASGELLQLVRLAPVGGALVYVHNNDLYYRPSLYSTDARITASGVPGVVYNGVPDWVYEEEVLGAGSAVWFSPDGSSIAFASFNDSEVKTASYFHYGAPGSLESQYVETVNIRYPKPGTPNPWVSLHVVDLRYPTHIVNLPAPVESVSPDHILFAVTWASSSEVAAVWTNRVQNIATTRICEVASGACQDAHSKFEADGWVDVTTPVFDDSGTRFATVLPQPQSGGAGNYAQVTLVDRHGMERPLTSGRAVVTMLHGWDKINNVIYYQATPEDAPAQRHVYQVAADGSSTRCLSCSLVTPEGRACLYASASFSKDLSHVALICAGPDPAHVSLHRAPEFAQLVLWEDNQALRNKLRDRAMFQILNTDVDVPGGFRAKARLWVPPGIDTSGRTKYPLLVYVYGGPNSAQISDAFTLGWGAYLTTNRSIVYAMIDGRGSGMKGDAMRFSVYRRLGTVEVLDQIGVTTTLLRMFPFLDAARAAIWGWSYGGYATAMTLARDSGGVFKCGASVAPVTSWIYYDAIYTERYMGLPTHDDNLAGYNDSDVTRRVAGFRGKQFYLLHGNADDNVHYLQAMMLSRALELNNILFRQQSYPDENHNLRSVLLHVYGSMDQFWQQCFSS